MVCKCCVHGSSASFIALCIAVPAYGPADEAAELRRASDAEYLVAGSKSFFVSAGSRLRQLFHQTPAQ